MDIFTLSRLADFSTIGGVIFAITCYFLWQHDYKSQKAHEYAMRLLQKIKHLHMEIESIRSPHFVAQETLPEDIENKYIPLIKKVTSTKTTEINVELLIAEKTLVKHKNLQSNFQEKIVGNILTPINIAMSEYIAHKNLNPNKFNAESQELYKIIFPSQQEPRPKTDKSTLGAGMEVFNDDFNKDIQKNFSSIYEDLEDNLVIWENKLYRLYSRLKAFLKKSWQSCMNRLNDRKLTKTTYDAES